MSQEDETVAWIGKRQPVWDEKTISLVLGQVNNMWASKEEEGGGGKIDMCCDSSSDEEDEDEEDENEELHQLCINIREHAIVTMACGRGVPQEITELLFMKLLSTTATNHALAATLFMSIKTMPPGIASNCWRPKSWSVVADVLNVVSDEKGRMERSTRFGNHVLALSIVVEVFEAERRAHVAQQQQQQQQQRRRGRDGGAAADPGGSGGGGGGGGGGGDDATLLQALNRGETTLGHWMSRGEKNPVTHVSMLPELVNKAIIVYTLSSTNEILGHGSFTAIRAWCLCRKLLDVALWALLDDVTTGGGGKHGASNISSVSSARSSVADAGALRLVQLKLLSELWAGMESVSHDNTSSFLPKDGRGALFCSEHCARIASLLQRSREPWAYRLREYCEKAM